MSKTMVANITGARLRDTERELSRLRGEDAVSSYIDAHPNEMKVLQQLVEWRRAGRPVPALARIQRAMLWSDGTIQFNTAPGEDPASRGAGGLPSRGGGPAQRSSGDPRRGAPFAGGQRPSAARTDSSAARGASGPAGTGRPGGARPGFERPAFGRGGGTGSAFGGRPSSGAPGRRGPGRGRHGDEDEGGSMRGMPRSGEGWVLLRPGEAPPPEPAPEEEYAEEDAAAPVTVEGSADEGLVSRPVQTEREIGESEAVPVEAASVGASREGA